MLSPTKMVTHAIVAPLGSHWKRATCEEYGCLPHQNGWRLETAGLTAEQVATAKRSGRRYVVEHDAQGAEVLIFEAGQQCFRVSEHWVRLEREEFFLRRPGDWRGNPDPHSSPLVFSGADAWHDSIGTQLDKIRVVD